MLQKEKGQHLYKLPSNYVSFLLPGMSFWVTSQYVSHHFTPPAAELITIAIDPWQTFLWTRGKSVISMNLGQQLEILRLIIILSTYICYNPHVIG